MAYDASNKGDQQQQVASSTPLSQGQAAPAQQTPSDSGASAPSQPATIQAGANTAQQAAGQAQPSQNKSQGSKASSGMFTNIQKYAQANQPQATKMAKAAGSVLEKQATNVGEQVAKQQQMQQGQVQAYNARMEAAKKFADRQIWLAGGMQPDSSGNVPETTQGDSGLADREAYAQNQQLTLKDMANDPMNGIAISGAKHPNGIPTATPTATPTGFGSQQTVVGEMKEADDAYRYKQIINPYEGKQAGDIISLPKKDQWGRFVGTEQVTVTQEMIDNYGKPLKQVGLQDILKGREAYAQNQNRIKEYEQAALGDKYSDYMSEYNVLYGRNPDGSSRLTDHRAISPFEQEQINQEREANLQALRNKYFGEGQYGQLSETDIGRFRNLATGNEGFGQIQSMNLTPQQAEAARLQQQAGRAESDLGRRELLRQRFAQGGQQYTQGQQGLDALIVGSDQGARQALAQTAQGAAEQAQGGIQGALNQQAAALQGAEQSAQDFRTGLEEQTTGATKKMVSDIDAQVIAEQEARKQMLEELTGVQTGMQERIQGLQSMLDMGSKENRAKLMQDLGFSNIPKQTTYFDRGSYSMKSEDNPQYAAVQRFIETGDRNALTGIKHVGDGRIAERYLKQSVLGNLAGYDKDLQLLGIDPNLYKGSFDAEYNALRKKYHEASYGTDLADLITGHGKTYLDATRVLDEIAALNKKIGAFDTEKMLRQELEGVQGGLGLEDLRSGADITRESIASPEQMARYSALSKLAGSAGSDLIKENVRDRLTQDEMNQILEKLRNR